MGDDFDEPVCFLDAQENKGSREEDYAAKQRQQHSPHSPRAEFRLPRLPHEVHFGPGMVGVPRRQTLGILKNWDPTGAPMTLTATVVGEGIKAAFPTQCTVTGDPAQPDSSAVPLHVVVTPERIGPYSGTASIVCEWPDDRFEQQIDMSGSGWDPAQEKKQISIPKELQPQKDYVNPVAPRTPFQPSHVDLGEQIIGRTKPHYLVPITNNDPTGARMILTTCVVGDAFTGASDATRIVRSSHGGAGDGVPVAPIAFKFNPKSPGLYSATMHIACSWPDGAVEEKKVTIVARARSVDQKPEGQQVAEARAEGAKAAAFGRYAAEQMDTQRADNAESKETAPYPQNAANALDDAATRAKLNVEKLAREQGRAVNDLTGYAKEFEEEPEHDGELWKKLGKLGVQVATAALAAMTGSVASTAIGVVVGLISSETETHASPNEAEEKHGNHGEKVVEGLGAALEDAIKLSVDLAYEEATKEEASKGRASAQAFFSAQHAALDKAITKHGDYVHGKKKTLRPLMRSSTPGVAGDAMNALASALEVAANSGYQQQANSTREQWAAYVARSRNGKQRGSNSGVADLSKAHDHAMKGFAPQNPQMDGTLDINVALDGTEVRPLSARMTGVSVDVLEGLVSQDLSNPTFPVRLLFENGGIVITRDGNGIIRVSGWYERLVPGAQSEADALPRAQEIVAKICRVPLASQGIRGIRTNDKNGEKTER